MSIFSKTPRLGGGELSALIWMIIFGAFLGIAISLFDIASVANFLEVYNHSYLPGAIICSGLLGIFTANTFISIQNWVSYFQVALLTIFILLVASFVIYVGYAIDPVGTVVYVGFVLAGPFTVLALLVFWNLFERLFDLSQGRRLSVTAESGMVLAAVSTLTIIAVSDGGSFKPTYDFYLNSFYFLLVAFFLLLVLAVRRPYLRKVVINVQYIKAYNNYKRLLRQPYFILLASVALLSAITFFLTDYVYLVMVDMQQTTPEDILRFLAGFSAATIGAGFILQLFVVKLVNSKYGYLASLLILPILVGLFTVIYGVLGTLHGYSKEDSVFFFIFMLVCISKLLSVSLYRSLEFSTYKFFFMPLDNLLRSDLQSKVERVVREVGKCIAGIMVVFILHYFAFAILPYVLIGIMIIWGVMIVVITKAYRDKLKVTLDEPEEVQKKERVADSVVDELQRIIPEAKGKEVEVYLNLLKILDPLVYKEFILGLLESEDENIQRVALLETSRLCLLPAIPILKKIEESKFYPILSTRDLIDKVYAQLKAAEFRLEKVKYIEQLTLSKLHHERVFGALLAAYAEESMKPRLLTKLFLDQDPKVRFSAVLSSANTESSEIHKKQIEKLGDAYYGNVAVSSLSATGEKALNSMESAFYQTGQEEKIQLRIVQAYGKIRSEKAVQLLLKKLNYTNQNINRAAFEAVSHCGFNVGGERVLQFNAELEEYVSVLVWNISAYQDLLEIKASEVLCHALLSEIESNYNSIFKLLTLLFDPKTVGLIKENIFSSDAEKSEYAFGLLEVILTDNIKPFLLPVLNNSAFDVKLKKMQEYFPTESMQKVDLLYDLVQRDYKYVNRWTKACALKELAEEKGEIDIDIFVANVINPDPLLKETAAVALYMKAPEFFPPVFERFQRDLGAGYSKEVIKKIVPNTPSKSVLIEAQSEILEKLDKPQKVANKVDYFTAPNLKFEFIKFAKEVNEFKNVPGIVLMELAKISEFVRFNQGEIISEYDNHSDLDYFIIRTGKVKVAGNNSQDGSSFFGEKAFVHYYNLISKDDDKVTLTADTACELYRIKQAEFNEVLSFFEEIPLSIIKNSKALIHKK